MTLWTLQLGAANFEGSYNHANDTGAFPSWLEKNLNEKTAARVELQKEGNNGYTVSCEKHTSEFKQDITPDQPYSPNHDFKEYLDGDKALLESRTYSLLIPSLSGNWLVIPKGPYTTFKTFLDKAKPEEKGFWALVEYVRQLLCKAGKEFTMATHIGSASGQAVAHFHYRFELEDRTLSYHALKKTEEDDMTFLQKTQSFIKSLWHSFWRILGWPQKAAKPGNSKAF